MEKTSTTSFIVRSILKKILQVILILSLIPVILFLALIGWNIAVRGEKTTGSCFVNIYGQAYMNMGSALWDGESGGSNYRRMDTDHPWRIKTIEKWYCEDGSHVYYKDEIVSDDPENFSIYTTDQK